MTAARRTAAEQRIRRLRNAIGDGPHSASIDPHQYVRHILVTLKDHDAIAVFEREKTAA